MTINGKGEVTDYRIEETVICVDKRMTYTAVKKILEDRDEEERRKYESLVPMFELMEELAAILRNRRHKRGPLISILQRVRSFWMKKDIRWRLSPMSAMWRRRSSRILC